MKITKCFPPNTLDKKYTPDTDYASFTDVDLKTLQTLIDNQHLDPEETQNNSPTAQEFIDLIRRHPILRAHRYIISDSREDKQAAIEGIKSIPDHEISLITFIDILNLCARL